MTRFAVLLALVCAACRGSPSERGGGPNPMVEPVVGAWCQHHFTCGRVAPSKRFRDLPACEVHVREQVEKDLRGCNQDDTKLNACLAAIHDKTCDAFRVVTPDACERMCE